jgi:acylphosphatase
MAKHLVISGRVQGVGYRASFAAQARMLGLSGWVRNRLDGTVEATVDGEAAAIDKILEWAKRGPPLAQVERVITQDTDDASVEEGEFHMLPTM